MNTITTILILTALGAALWFFAPALCARLKKPATSLLSAFAIPHSSFRVPHYTAVLANIGEGEHIEFQSLYPVQAIGTRYLIAKNGTGGLGYGDLCGINDIPIGIWYDETGTTTDLTQKRAVALLGARQTTCRVAINSTVALGDLLVPDTGSYARTIPAAGATPVIYHVIGKALKAGVAGDVIEFDPIRLILTVAPVAGTFVQASADVATTAPVNVSPYGYGTSAQALAILTQINNLVTDVAAIKTELNL